LIAMRVPRFSCLPIAMAIALVACGSDGPGTSVRIALAYDDALGLDTAEVTLGDRTLTAPIEHELLLLVSDDTAGNEMPIAVWGRKEERRTAYGTATAVPVRGKTVAADLSLTACTPGCDGNTLMTCTGEPKSCQLGCSEDGDAHCLAPSASNGIDLTLVDTLAGTTTFASTTVFDTDTGTITGSVARAPGQGVNNGIMYAQAPPSGPGGVALGIFAFHNLAIDGGANIRISGARAAVLLVGDTAGIAGVIDVSGGRPARSSAGPGGGAGGSLGAQAGGCGAGAAGGHGSLAVPTDDGGGGGGGGGVTGAPGGGRSTPLVGVGGAACLPPLLEPLQGGSGGGRGGGPSGQAAVGGGGGGALQITALRVLVLTGTITAGGGGGDSGALSAVDPGAGAGGGAGGALLLEAPMLTIAGSAIIAANGGGGGGGGGDVMESNMPGADGGASDQFALGGAGTLDDNGGGTGGALASPPDVGRNAETNGNAGGGGGASGRVVLRGHARLVSGKISPQPTIMDVKPPS
jgi:hypothetical protein